MMRIASDSIRQSELANGKSSQSSNRVAVDISSLDLHGDVVPSVTDQKST